MSKLSSNSKNVHHSVFVCTLICNFYAFNTPFKQRGIGMPLSATQQQYRERANDSKIKQLLSFFDIAPMICMGYTIGQIRSHITRTKNDAKQSAPNRKWFTLFILLFLMVGLYMSLCNVFTLINLSFFALTQNALDEVVFYSNHLSS